MMKYIGEPLTDKEITVSFWSLADLLILGFSYMIIDEADIDNDGLIDYTEFFSMMNPK